MSNVSIKGLNLQIDESIHEICKTSNTTSSNTRGILYFVTLVNMLALIAVLNTNKLNWITDRIKSERSELARTKLDTIQNEPYQYGEYYIHRIKYEALTKSLVDNYMLVRLPILGSSFDVNDLSIVSGLTLSFLLLVLRFTIIREASNLNIAMNAVTGRYPDNANAEIFQEYVRSEAVKQKVDESTVLEEINRTRREHHYNYLSMNEVFNFPPTRPDNELTNDRLFIALRSGVSQLVFLLPAITYLIVGMNDFYTRQIGDGISKLHTNINFNLTIFFFATILFLCIRCIRQENRISKTYKKFYNGNFEYKKPIKTVD